MTTYDRYRDVFKQIALKTALEAEAYPESSEAKTLKEHEYTWYGKLRARSLLDKAKTICEQEQWSLFTPETVDGPFHGSVRVRHSKYTRGSAENGAKDFYMMTVKVFEKGKPGCRETEFEINKTVFDQFKLLCADGMRKVRYSFPLSNGLELEVDVPEKETEWVKIDLEVEPDQVFKLKPMENFKDLIREDDPSLSKEEKRKIERIKEDFFLINH